MIARVQFERGGDVLRLIVCAEPSRIFFTPLQDLIADMTFTGAQREIDARQLSHECVTVSVFDEVGIPERSRSRYHAVEHIRVIYRPQCKQTRQRITGDETAGHSQILFHRRNNLRGEHLQPFFTSACAGGVPGKEFGRGPRRHVPVPVYPVYFHKDKTFGTCFRTLFPYFFALMLESMKINNRCSLVCITEDADILSCYIHRVPLALCSIMYSVNHQQK